MIDFQLHRPESIDEVFELLDRYGQDARLLAGGTALVLQMKQRLARPAHVISMRRLTGMNAVEETGDGVRIGSLCTHRYVENHPVVKTRLPLLAETVARVATPRIRNMATIGGGLVNGDPNQDPPPSLIALDAEVELVSASGSRTIPAEELFLDYYETDVQPGEVLSAVTVPPQSEDSGWAYLKFLPRTADDYGTVSVAAVVRRDADGACITARIVLGSVGVTPVRAHAAEELLTGSPLCEDSIRNAAGVVLDAVDPLDDFRGSAGYKREMAEVFTRRALLQAAAAIDGMP